jgi:hypothetical protein
MDMYVYVCTDVHAHGTVEISTVKLCISHICRYICIYMSVYIYLCICVQVMYVNACACTCTCTLACTRTVDARIGELMPHANTG